MEIKNNNRIRVLSCLKTIIDVHRTVSLGYDNDKLLEQFEELKQAIDNMDMKQISEGDIMVVEKATNALLGEFRPVFATEKFGLVYGQVNH